MRVLFVFSVFSIMIINFAYAQNIQSEIIFSEKKEKIKEGDLIEGTLRFWPIENVDLSQFKKLEKTVLFDGLYLAQIINLGPSENNADVIELEGLFVVKSAKLLQSQILKYNDQLIEVKTNELRVEELANKQQDYYILDQSLNSSKLWIVVTFSALMISLMAFFKRKKLKELFEKLIPNASKKEKKKYDVLFRKADKREEFELIYQEKDKWLAVLEDKTPAHIEFFRILNQFQYKKEWSNEDYLEVRTSFDVIRRSFEK